LDNQKTEAKTRFESEKEELEKEENKKIARK
jgi:hypothetical protein